MTRPLPIAACLALAVVSLAALAQTAPPADTDQPETVLTEAGQTREDQAGATQPEGAQSEPDQPESDQPEPATPAPSQQPQVELTGSAQRGEMLTYTCQGCHGVPGYKNVYPHYHVPMIGGQSEAYLASTLNAYKQGTRKHPTMQAQAQSFSAQDIADIAAYLSELKP